MLIGITGSPRQTDNRLAKHLEGTHFFTHHNMRSPLGKALLALYGNQLYDYTTSDKANHRIPFANNHTYAELESHLHRFLQATSGPQALRVMLEATLAEPHNRNADLVITGLTLNDAGWFHAQGGILVIVDDHLETSPTPPADIPHFLFRNDNLGVDEFLVAADTMLDKAKRKHLNVIQQNA